MEDWSSLVIVIRKREKWSIVKYRTATFRSDNSSLLNQLASLHGVVSLPVSSSNRARLREIPSLVSWVYCFITNVAVRTSDSSTRDMLAYCRLLIREALRHGGNGWVEYDRVFRRQQSINPGHPWNTLDPGLQAATILGQRMSGTFCTICKECDHASSHCALAPIQQQLQPVSAASLHTSRFHRPPRRPESLLYICGTRGPALGQPAHIVMCVCDMPGINDTGPETAQILQQNQTINQWSPGLGVRRLCQH